MKFQLLICFLLISSLTQAKVFRNAYISFEMPDAWKCNLEQTEWVCRSELSKEAKEAIIILTAKEVGPTDSLQMYDAHLGENITNTSRSGNKITSKVIYKPKHVTINDSEWIDGLHQGSEVENYFTRYMATIKDNIAILVTLSAHKDFYTKYSSQDFFKTINSLRVIAAKNLLSQPDLGPLRPGSETLGAPISQSMPTDMLPQGEAPKKKAKNKLLLYGLAGALALAGIFLVLRSKK